MDLFQNRNYFMVRNFLYCFLSISLTCYGYQWSFQSRLIVPEASAETFGNAPFAFSGRGFSHIISGYSQSAANLSLYVHTNDDGYASRGKFVWSQQAILKPNDPNTVAPNNPNLAGDQFGYWMVSFNQTLLVSSPYRNLGNVEGAGCVYVFNGSLRLWTQVQKLVPDDATQYANFGRRMSLDGLFNQRVAISANGAATYSGAVYIYEKQPNGVLWSRTSKLVARDSVPASSIAAIDTGSNFGFNVATFNEHTIATSNNDLNSPLGAGGSQSGAAYVFKSFSGMWSQQQKLIADDVYDATHTPLAGTTVQTSFVNKLVKKFGYDVTVWEGRLAVTYNKEDAVPESVNEKYVYIFSEGSASRWTLQQRLFADNTTVSDPTHLVVNASLHMRNNTLISTVSGPNYRAAYVFNTSDGVRWSQSQRIINENPLKPMNISNPNIWGGNMLMTGRHSLDIYTNYHNGSCLLIWMTDHYGDGWDIGVLTVQAPDTTNNTFHPHCDQVDPFQVRYCPYQPEDTGVYTVKVYAPTNARFFWEMSYMVTLEDTGETFKGDYATKIRFKWNPDSLTFSFYDIENPIDIEKYLGEQCYRCMRFTQLEWKQLERPGGISFFPLTVKNAPYYISDNEGRLVAHSGRVCEGAIVYECYVTIKDGTYTLRLGGGLFGLLTGYPQPGATWSGCGRSGTDRDQFTFEIVGGECRPLLIQSMTRCKAARENTQMPSFSPTVAPTAPTISVSRSNRRLESAADPFLNDNPFKPVINDNPTTKQAEVGVAGPNEKDIDALFW